MKKRMIKRSFALLVAVTVVVAVLPMQALAVENKTPFQDIQPDAWYYSAVEYMNRQGYISGTSSTTFSPNLPTSRAMFVTILGRIEGIDAKTYSGTSSFFDVQSGWAEPYVGWASSKGVVNGIGNGIFNPNGNVTREQSATILYNYLKGQGYELRANNDALVKFKDGGTVSSYAVTPMKWAVTAGVITGDGFSLNPGSSATRAQTAAILLRVIAFMQKQSDTPATIQELVDSFLERFFSYAKAGDMNSFSTLFRNTSNTTIIDMFNHSNVMARMYPHRKDTIVTGSGSYLFVNSLFYKIKNQAAFNDGVNLYLSYIGGVLKVDMGSECVSALETALDEKVLQKGFVQARKGGKNWTFLSNFSKNYLFANSDGYYETLITYEVIYAWQEENGDVKMLLWFANGTDKPVSYSELSLQLIDTNMGPICNEQYHFDNTISAYSSTMLLLTIDSSRVWTGTAKWQSLFYHIECY